MGSDDPKRRNVAVDGRGQDLPHSEEEVKRIIQEAVADGQMLCCVVRTPSGDLAVPVLGEPSEELALALELAAQGYRRAFNRIKAQEAARRAQNN